MGEFTVIRLLDAPRVRVWQALTQPGCFESWLPAKPDTTVLDVRTGGSWQATVVSDAGEEIAVTGSYIEVSEPDRLVMTVPDGTVTAITLNAASTNTTEIAYTFDIDESMQALVSEAVDDVLGRVSKVLTRVGG